MGQSEIRDGMRIDWDVPIAMDDGVVLRADVYRPTKPGKVPAIITYGPYAKGLAFQEGYKSAWDIMAKNHPDVTAGSSNKYQNWEVVDPEKWVLDGYACVRVDSRGAGRSPGYIDHFSPRETQDFYDCIEWVARQDWCNGKVGINGISYYAMNSWTVASRQPPHLAAVCACADPERTQRPRNPAAAIAGMQSCRRASVGIEFSFARSGRRRAETMPWRVGALVLELQP